LLVVLADGLGHGPGAAAASSRAVAAVVESPEAEPAALVELVHQRLRGTRGAAVTVARLRAATPDRPGELVVAGVGNVAAAVASPEGQVRRTLIGHGTAGLAVRRPPKTTTAVPAGSVVILHTDGLTSAWNLLGRTEVLRSAPVIIAAALLRDFERGNDDTGIVVVAPEGPAG
jgi:serine/threonine protein phosphatase PrpC